MKGGLSGLSVTPAGSASSWVPAWVPSVEKNASAPDASVAAKITWFPTTLRVLPARFTLGSVICAVLPDPAS